MSQETAGRGGLKVGELARRAGLTVRALHHWESMGILRPSMRTRSGHRLYGPEDLERLQQILSLRQLGLSLVEIRSCLDRPELSPREVLRLHMERVREQLESARRLHARLAAVAARLDSAERVSVEDLLAVIREITMMEKRYTPEQIEQFRQAAEAAGPEEIQAVQQEWTSLLSEVREARDLDPASERAQELGRRWEALTHRTMQGFVAFDGLNDAIARNYADGTFDGVPGTPQREDFAFIERVKEARGSAGPPR